MWNKTRNFVALNLYSKLNFVGLFVLLLFGHKSANPTRSGGNRDDCYRFFVCRYLIFNDDNIT